MNKFTETFIRSFDICVGQYRWCWKCFHKTQHFLLINQTYGFMTRKCLFCKRCGNVKDYKVP